MAPTSTTSFLTEPTVGTASIPSTRSSTEAKPGGYRRWASNFALAFPQGDGSAPHQEDDADGPAACARRLPLDPRWPLVHRGMRRARIGAPIWHAGHHHFRGSAA